MSAMIKIERCDYCSRFIENENFLSCQKCQGNVHIKCLPNSSTPGDLEGDIFFDLTCISCVKSQTDNNASTSSKSSTPHQEILVRHHLSWVMVIVLVLYNLGIKSKGLSHHGYFHWQNHIANFIEKNWKYLFDTAPRRRKRWIGTVAGVLSHHSPDFFISGFNEFNQSGWWKLTHSNRTPKYILLLYEQFCQKRQQQRVRKRLPIESLTGLVEPKKLRNSADSEEDTFLMGTCSRALPYMGRKPKIAKKLEVDEEDNRTTTQSNLMDFLAETFSNDELGMLNSIANNENLSPDHNAKHELIPFLESHNTIACDEESSISVAQEGNSQSGHGHESEKTCNVSMDEDSDNDEAFKPRIVQVTNFQEAMLKTTKINNLTERERQPKAVLLNESNAVDSEPESVISLPPCKPSRFTKTQKRLWPWLVQRECTAITESVNQPNEINTSNFAVMSTYEEAEMLVQLRRILATESRHYLTIPAEVRRFYRKLCVREWKRAHGKSLFDLDNYQEFDVQEKKANDRECKILDRYQLLTSSDYETRKSFYARIAGSEQPECFLSPYTQRVLHPYIFRNRLCFPPWLKLMCEVQFSKTGVPPSRASIDYCYVRPNHIAAINALLQMLFWPGIDMSECLSYPDYSVVALYKQLVIGCGFLVPDVAFNEAYISFMAVRPGWQRSGIATFMLYHLTQTCLTKDITLHVSATNPAVMLYQKFGFKVEEIILNFYDKYLPLHSKHSRHALLLRLSR